MKLWVRNLNGAGTLGRKGGTLSVKRTPVRVNIGALPDELARVLQDCAVFDSSCSREAKVLFFDRDGGLFLYYGTWEGQDLLLTRRIPGEDLTHPQYLSDPKRLCGTAAELLRQLHETDGRSCPVPDRNRTYTETVKKGFDGSHYEPDLFRGLWEFASFEEAKRAAQAGLPLLKKEVLLHGDYCLPNIILNDWRFSGFIDLGNGGIGDRHIDILWGVWTLNFNLKTTKYTDRFLDAYGRDRIEPEMLRAAAAMEMIGG